ncbi:60S ribosomal protein l25, putative [Theileria annulata]|uniref:60S ribosomal protein l25, putative n=1 Tax=Theileria annulata TaxID=5874 RepID=Q4UB99_THEAN|nr:60S ribosomal protein l25, putative [Theileria annulata]CAI75902.1 60S ribosomal protein l25, putative [Theileria annulata]|eukprot:XP_955378.1 60S ribosomal protein l25, putative [Theileria annulata]
MAASSSEASKSDKTKKALLASRSVKKSTTVKKVKTRRNTHFFRGRTLSLKRTPKFEKRVKTAYTKKLDKFSIVRYPLTTESAMKMIEELNTLVFVVDPRANKAKVAKAVSQLYDITPVHVNTLIRPDGQKKAFVRLSADQDALDVANKIGII